MGSYVFGNLSLHHNNFFKITEQTEASIDIKQRLLDEFGIEELKIFGSASHAVKKANYFEKACPEYIAEDHSHINESYPN